VNEARRAVAQRVFEAASVHDAAQADRLLRHRVLEPVSAELLGVLVRVRRATRVLELGTSIGHSTLWLADAAEAAGGSVVSVDLDAERSRAAASALAEAGLSTTVELRVEDAAETLRRSPDAHWQLVFLDAERPHYAAYVDDLVRVLAPSGLLVVDNVVSHASEVEPFLRLVEARPELTSTVVPVGAGLLLAVREP
jgi:predicted O-methyltransferase YrrM